MNEQEQKTLEEVAALSRENNEMIHKLIAAQRWSTIVKAIYWVIIIGATLIAYFALSPYLSAVMKIYSGGDINQVLDTLPK